MSEGSTKASGPKRELPSDEREGPTQTNMPAATLRNLEAGEVLGEQWRLESKIGQGGMGNVFAATELKLGRKVAVKALHVENLDDETVKRFEREAQVMGKLDHPNVITLYSVGRHRAIPFLVMRFLEGGSLWDVLDANGGMLTPEQMVPLVKQLCAALSYIHGKSLIHRDLKPSNIFVSPQGKVTLLDLGLARGHESSLTRTGVIWGTPDFMAPEQIIGEKQLDGRADLYALAVVMYRMMAGQPPFSDQDEQALMRSHLTRPRPDISKLGKGHSQGLGLMLQRALAIKPEERFQTADELFAAFEKAVATREQGTRARIEGPVPSPRASPAVATIIDRKPVAPRARPESTLVGEADTGPTEAEVPTGPSNTPEAQVVTRPSAPLPVPPRTKAPAPPVTSPAGAPVWLQPWVLVVGGVVLLGLGFLVGMLVK